MDTPTPDEARIKEPPRSSEAEQAVIGALLVDNQRWDEVAEILSSQDFFYKNNQLIYQAISELSENGATADAISVLERLRDKDQLENAGGAQYLRQIAEELPSTVNARIYAQIVRENSIRRQIIRAGNDMSNSAFFPEGRSARALLDDAERNVFLIAESLERARNQGLISIQEALAETLGYLEEVSGLDSDITGIPTGFTELDNKTSGLQRGDLIIIAGRPSMGKTAFSLNIAQAVALLAELPVAIFSLEMPARQLVMRMISALSSLTQEQLRKAEHGDRASAFKYVIGSQLLNAKIFIDDSSNISINELRNRCRRLKREQGELGLILIDYIQLMELSGDNNNRATQIGDLSRALKLLAKELDVPIIALSQLNRELEKRTDKRPIMSDIRESGAIEQDADIIMFVYRDSVYHKDTDPNSAEIIIAKQRNGPIGTVHLNFIKEYSRFSDAIRHMEEEY